MKLDDLRRLEGLLAPLDVQPEDGEDARAEVLSYNRALVAFRSAVIRARTEVVLHHDSDPGVDLELRRAADLLEVERAGWRGAPRRGPDGRPSAEPVRGASQRRRRTRAGPSGHPLRAGVS